MNMHTIFGAGGAVADQLLPILLNNKEKVRLVSRSAKSVAGMETVAADATAEDDQLQVDHRHHHGETEGEAPRLVTDQENLPGSRVLEGNFTAVQQAAGVPKGRTAAQAWLKSPELVALEPQRARAYRVIRQYIVEAP